MKQPNEEGPYQRLLGDAMKGDGALFTREDAVEAAWEVVNRVLKNHHPVRRYKRGTWGRKKLTHSSLQTVVGTTQVPMEQPNSRAFPAKLPRQLIVLSRRAVPAPKLFLRVLDPDREEIVPFILSDEHYGTAISPAIQKNRSEAE